MITNVEVLIHSSIKISGKKIIYIDPFKIRGIYKDADIIFITHDHYDHYSEEDIQKVRKENTTIVVPEDLKNKAMKLFKTNYIITVQPNQKYKFDNFIFETIPAYNINKEFHPKSKKWVGYILEIEGIRYYIAGDTDVTEEDKKVKCDVALVPIGGTYTMDYKQAAELINEIKPKIAIPIHYGSIVGTIKDAIEFAQLIDSKIQCEIFIK